MSLRRKIIYVAIGGAVAFLFWFIPFTPAFNIGTINQTRYIYSTRTSFQKLVGPGHPGWTKSQNVSKHVLAAFVSAEDGKFYEHKGLDFEAIEKSWLHNKKNKKKIRGGSTITQQVVKVGLLSYERSYIRKVREAIGALLLEQSLDKNEILEWYINMVEFGDGIYGIAEASRSYFKVPPEKLTIAQAVSLALVLPAPNKWSKGLKARNLSLFNQKRFKFILKQMLLGGFITRGQWQQTMASGNFGRPIVGYTDDIRNDSRDEQSEIDPIHDLDEAELDDPKRSELKLDDPKSNEDGERNQNSETELNSEGKVDGSNLNETPPANSNLDGSPNKESEVPPQRNPPTEMQGESDTKQIGQPSEVPSDGTNHQVTPAEEKDYAPNSSNLKESGVDTVEGVSGSSVTKSGSDKEEPGHSQKSGSRDE
jgi:monofunctional biosynthetic peptidoglycan transglycosylase